MSPQSKQFPVGSHTLIWPFATPQLCLLEVTLEQGNKFVSLTIGTEAASWAQHGARLKDWLKKFYLEKQVNKSEKAPWISFWFHGIIGYNYNCIGSVAICVLNKMTLTIQERILRIIFKLKFNTLKLLII